MRQRYFNFSAMQVQPFLEPLGIQSLLPMQEATLAASRIHAKLVLLSATGSGKTIGFLLPVLEKMTLEKKGTQSLIVVPTRELALQIEKVFRKMNTGFGVTCCYGGHKREVEENNLKEAPAVVIGTPGRLADHIRRGNISTAGISQLVLDEFDKMMEFGFDEELSFIIQSLPAISFRLLVSATEALSLPGFVDMSPAEVLNFLSGETAAGLQLLYCKAPSADKLDTLFQLLCLWGGRSTIVFCNFRDTVEKTSEWLRDRGLVNVFYHGALEQDQRETALAKFTNGTADVLVTTDLAARGLDIKHIRYIIHFQLPADEAAFTHRNGRTARMEESGTALLLLGEDEFLPDYAAEATAFTLPAHRAPVPEKPKWVTLLVAAGKKDKINKVDIVGFLTQKGQLKKDEVGLIEVKDFHAFVAVRRSKASSLLAIVKNEKIKGRKVKIDYAK